jgi:hypothetical protein
MELVPTLSIPKSPIRITCPQNPNAFLMVGDEILAFGDGIGANFIYPQKSHKNNIPNCPQNPNAFLMVGDGWGQVDALGILT